MKKILTTLVSIIVMISAVAVPCSAAYANEYDHAHVLSFSSQEEYLAFLEENNITLVDSLDESSIKEASPRYSPCDGTHMHASKTYNMGKEVTRYDENGKTYVVIVLVEVCAWCGDIVRYL